MQRYVHLSLGCVEPVLDGYKNGWTGKKMKEYVSVVHFISKTHLKFVTRFNSCVHQTMCAWQIFDPASIREGSAWT